MSELSQVKALTGVKSCRQSSVRKEGDQWPCVKLQSPTGRG